MGTEKYEDGCDHGHDHDHGHDGGKDHDHHDKCSKDYLRAALERLGFAVRKLDHLLEDLVHGSKKIGKERGKEKEMAWD